MRNQTKYGIDAFVKPVALSIVVFLLFGCGANEGILKSGKETPAPVNSIPSDSTLEKDIADMRTADFKFIYVLRRKDGGELDGVDRSVIKVSTVDANRRVSSENGKAFVVGSNFQIPPEKMGALYDRFAIENYSKPDAVNSAVNVNAK